MSQNLECTFKHPCTNRINFVVQTFSQFPSNLIYTLSFLKETLFLHQNLHCRDSTWAYIILCNNFPSVTKWSLEDIVPIRMILYLKMFILLCWRNFRFCLHTSLFFVRNSTSSPEQLYKNSPGTTWFRRKFLVDLIPQL